MNKANVLILPIKFYCIFAQKKIMEWIGIVVIILLGLAALLLEILVLPGGVVGITGTLFIVAGIILAYVRMGATAGTITLAATVLFIIFIIIMMFRKKTWKRVMLEDNITGKMNVIDESKISVGMTGIAVSRLAPAGKGKFNNEIEEVHSSHGFIDVGKEIIITKIESNKIIVKLK